MSNLKRKSEKQMNCRVDQCVDIISAVLPATHTMRPRSLWMALDEITVPGLSTLLLYQSRYLKAIK